MTSKTITIYDGEFPEVTLLPGTHHADGFNEAFQRESYLYNKKAWDESELQYEFWENSLGVWRKSSAMEMSSELVTIAYWD